MTKHTEAEVRRAVEAMTPEERALLLAKAMLKLQAQPRQGRSPRQAAFLGAANRLRRTLAELDTDVERSAPTTQAGRLLVSKAAELSRGLAELANRGPKPREAQLVSKASVSPEVARVVEAAHAAMAECRASADRLERGIALAGRGRVH